MKYVSKLTLVFILGSVGLFAQLVRYKSNAALR